MSGFELSKRFDGKPIDCTVMIWHARFAGKEKKKDQDDHRKMTVAPHASSFLGVGFGGEWKAKSFYLDPKQAAIRISEKWVLISDIDAASQFTVEKEHAVAFPHESKQIYVSGHVGLHIHAESTDEAWTMAFPGFELADVAFDAVNKLSYEQLSQQIFNDVDSDDESSQQAAASGGMPPKGKRGADGKTKVKHLNHQQQQQHHQADDDDENFVATSGTELLDRGKLVDINEFTAFFLEDSHTGGDSAGGANSGPPSGGIVRLRKETGSLSTWLARMEPGETERIYFMKLSKASIKTPLNKIIQRSSPSVAKHFGPVVPLEFRNLTIRSESAHPQFILEEVYTAANGDTRSHRLICVFKSLEERMRWEDWLGGHGVRKFTVESSKKGAGATGGEEGQNGRDGDDDKDKKGGEKKEERKMDPAMQLIWECFDLDDSSWERPRRLGTGDEDDDVYEDFEDNGAQDPFFNASFASTGSKRVQSPSSPLRNESMAALSVVSGGQSFVSSSEQLPPGSPGSGRATSPMSGRRRRIGRPGSPSKKLSSSPEKPLPTKTVEQEAVELEASERCRWFAGYTPAKENKWAALSNVLKKERSAGSQIFTAVAKLKGEQSAQFDDDGRAHIMGSPTSSSGKSPLKSPLGGSKQKLSALIRAGQISRAVDAIKRAKDNPAGSSEETSADTVRAITALNELDSAEQQAMIAEIEKQREEQAEKATVQREEREQQQQSQSPMADGLASAASASSFIVPHSPGQLRTTTSSSPEAVAHMQNSAAASILHEEASLTPQERTARRMQDLQREQQMNKDRRHGAPTLTLPNELSTHFQMQRQAEQHQRVLLSGELPTDGSMFGRPRLYGDGLRPKFQPINLRSEGFVDPESVQSAVRQTAPNASAAAASDGSAGAAAASAGAADSQQTPQQRRDSSSSSSSPTQGAVSRPHYDSSSPAADAARSFQFGFHSPDAEDASPGASGSAARNRRPSFTSGGGATGDERWTSALYEDEQKNKRRRNSNKNIDTSSDSDDEISRRFAHARAMRAARQLGEDFVGPSGSSGWGSGRRW